MDKQTFLVDKLYNEILAEVQRVYACIGINKLANDYDEYKRHIDILMPHHKH